MTAFVICLIKVLVSIFLFFLLFFDFWVESILIIILEDSLNYDDALKSNIGNKTYGREFIKAPVPLSQISSRSGYGLVEGSSD